LKVKPLVTIARWEDTFPRFTMDTYGLTAKLYKPWFIFCFMGSASDSVQGHNWLCRHLCNHCQYVQVLFNIMTEFSCCENGNTREIQNTDFGLIIRLISTHHWELMKSVGS
jgi:hypothetical protein